MQIILKYFQNLNAQQQKQFEMLGTLYPELNEKINVISRKDIENLYERHILHSLAIAKFINLQKGTNVIDVGTGGGFPGIPLAIMFPEVSFHLVDSIAKKLKVVETISQAIGLNNIRISHTRVEQLKDNYDFIVSRAVTAFPDFVDMSKARISKKMINSMPNGIIYLKGGDFDHEIKPFRKLAEVVEISNYFEEDFFETKKIIYLPI